MNFLRKFILLFAVLIAPVVLFAFPQAAPWLKYFHVICIVLSTFVGRGFLREGDIRGWAIQLSALLAHAAFLIFESMAFSALIA